MGSLREINFDMDMMTKSVEAIERKCSTTAGGRKAKRDEAETRKLFDEIDRELKARGGG